MVLPSFNENIKLLKKDSEKLRLNFENIVIHSRLKDFEKRVDDSGLSIKTSLDGEEHYLINNHLHSVGPGKYLLVNKHQSFDCYVKAEKEVEAFCFYLSEQLIQEVINAGKYATDWHLDHFGQIDQQLPFLEKVYHMKENALGIYLEQVVIPLIQKVLRSEVILWDFNSFYYAMAEKLVESQLDLKQQLQNLSSVKSSTKEELYRRLSLAFAYISDNFHRDIQLDELSRIATLSKFHLLRSFKKVYGITPYQKVLQLRLKKAKELLIKNISLEEVAFQVGFSDRRSFTKAFKKMFGIPPSTCR